MCCLLWSNGEKKSYAINLLQQTKGKASETRPSAWESIKNGNLVQGCHPPDTLGNLHLDLRLNGVRIVERGNPDLHHTHLVERCVRKEQARAARRTEWALAARGRRIDFWFTLDGHGGLRDHRPRQHWRSWLPFAVVAMADCAESRLIRNLELNLTAMASAVKHTQNPTLLKLRQPLHHVEL
jgi:hypothetical protein